MKISENGVTEVKITDRLKALEVLAATWRDRPRRRGPLRERGGRLRASRDGRCWTSRRTSERAIEMLMKHLERLTQQISLEHAGALSVVDEETSRI